MITATPANTTPFYGFSFATVAMLCCSGLLTLYGCETVAQCYTNGLLITIYSNQRAATNTVFPLYNRRFSQSHYGIRFTTLTGTQASLPHALNFSACRVTGVLRVSRKSVTYTWHPSLSFSLMS